MTYYMIDAPVGPLDPIEDIQEWIETLKSDYPQDNEQVQEAIADVEMWFKWRKERIPSENQ